MQQVGTFMQRIGAFGDEIREGLLDCVPVDQNHAFSSLALYLALSTACLGAAGKSYEELRTLLHLNGKDDLAELRPVLNTLVASGVFTIENSVTAGVHLHEQFQAKARDYLGSEIVAGRPDTMDLISHLTLDAAWLRKFDPKNTVPASFQRLNGSAIMVDMMNQKKKLPYGKDSNFEWVVLGHESKHENQEAPVLILFLPKHGVDFHQAGKLLTQERIEKAYAKANAYDDIELRLPKVFFERVVSVSQLFESSSLKHSFSTEADFSDATDIAARIQSIHIGVKQAWDEYGQKVEVVARVRACLGIADDITLSFNRPFYEVLYDPATKLILMQGRIVEPPPAGSKNPGRMSPEFQALLGTPLPNLGIQELRTLIADKVLNSLAGVDNLPHGQIRNIREQLITQLQMCDLKTLSQLYGFMHGPLAETLSEYTGRMLQAVQHIDRWQRIENARTDLSTAALSDLRDLLTLLISKPSYPEPPALDRTQDFAPQLERMFALLNHGPNLRDELLAQFSIISPTEAKRTATIDAMYCTPPEAVLARLQSFQEVADPASLIAIFQEPDVMTWIEGRTKQYMQEVRFNLAVLLEPPPAMRKSYEQTIGRPLQLWKSAKLAPQYFNPEVRGRGRFTYESGLGIISGDWDTLLNPHLAHLRGGSPLSFALSEQYSLSDDQCHILQYLISESMVFNLPFEMQQFLRLVWPRAGASQRLRELYAQAHTLVQQKM